MLTWHLFSHLVLSSRAGSLVRRIAILTIISIFVSVTAFLVVLFVMNGMNGSMKKRIMSLEPHLVIAGKNESLLAGLESSDFFLKIKEEPGQMILPYEKQDLIVKTMDGQFRGAIARGVTEESLNHLIESVESLRGSPKNQFSGEGESWELPQAGEILMGVDLARSLGVFEGDYVSFVSPEALLLPGSSLPRVARVRVSRIITTTLPDLDSQLVFYRKGDVLSSLSEYGLLEKGYEIFLKDGLKADLQKKFFPKMESIQIESWTDRNSSLFFALKMEKINIGVLLGLAGLISGSSILTVLTLLMSVKRRDIALLRTLGLSGRSAVALFTKIGLCLTMTGVLFGVVLGLGIGFYIQMNPLNILPEIYYDSSIPAQVDLSLVIFVVFSGLLLGLLGSIIPARQARFMEPAQLLKLKH